jgi:hypothetical protein
VAEIAASERGYVGVGGSDLSRWRIFAGKVLAWSAWRRVRTSICAWTTRAAVSGFTPTQATTCFTRASPVPDFVYILFVYILICNFY